MELVKFEYTKRTTKALHNKVKKDIIDAIEGDSAMRKEIARVFQQANRRIQNVEKAGLFSPAVAALGKQDVKGYSKFSVRGFGNTGTSWVELKREYAKAVAFLNQPTSSASGAREFEAQVKTQLNIDESLWKSMRGAIMGNFTSVTDKLLLALDYSKFMQEVYNRTMQQTAGEMENEAAVVERQLQAHVESEADRLAAQVVEKVEALDKMFDEKFKNFGIGR